MNTARTPSNAPAWIFCGLTLLALLGAGWYIWSALKSEHIVTAPEENPEQRAALRELEESHQDLLARIAELKALMEADPCAIPAEVHGLPLLPEVPHNEEQQTPPGQAQADQPGATPPVPTQGQPRTSPPAQPVAAVPETPNGAFAASNEAIESATTLIIAGDAMGTGFFVAPGIVLTNHHVVENNPDPVFLISRALGVTRGKVIAMTSEQDRDYALIRVGDNGNLPTPLPLCGGIRKTEKVGAWGFPALLSHDDPQFKALLQGDLRAVPEVIYSEGVVNVVYENMPPTIVHTAPISGGNSGGPLVNGAGCVVGVNTMVLSDSNSYRNAGVALSSKDLATFLWQHGVQATFSSTAGEVKP